MLQMHSAKIWPGHIYCTTRITHWNTKIGKPQLPVRASTRSSPSSASTSMFAPLLHCALLLMALLFCFLDWVLCLAAFFDGLPWRRLEPWDTTAAWHSAWGIRYAIVLHNNVTVTIKIAANRKAIILFDSSAAHFKQFWTTNNYLFDYLWCWKLHIVIVQSWSSIDIIVNLLQTWQYLMNHLK